METESKSEYIKVWKSELDNLRAIWCESELKYKLNIHINAIDKLIEQIADTKQFTEE